jgi:hypothetical protein
METGQGSQSFKVAQGEMKEEWCLALALCSITWRIYLPRRKLSVHY